MALILVACTTVCHFLSKLNISAISGLIVKIEVGIYRISTAFFYLLGHLSEFHDFMISHNQANIKGPSEKHKFVKDSWNLLYSGGYLAIVDLQGVDDGRDFILTDPAIHCIKPGFGSTNLGDEGIKECFRYLSFLGIFTESKKVYMNCLNFN